MATVNDHFPPGKESSGVLQYIVQAVKKLPPELTYTSLLFLASRAVLTVIGVIAYQVIGKKDYTQFPDWFNIWNVWDSERYLFIARHWYPTTVNMSDMVNYVFFPLYPLLMRLIGAIINNYYYAGLIISNVCLFVACFYIYRLVRLDSDESTAMRAIKYLFLFPTAFVLSGVLTESLFLALSLACFYYAKKGNWLASGVFGMLTALTRPYGVVIVIPMAYEYLRSIDFNVTKVRLDSLCLLLTPMGVCILGAYDYYKTGDFLAFAHAQSLWGLALQNPLTQLLMRLSEMGMDVRFNAVLTLMALLLLVIFYKKIGVSQLLYGLLIILIPLASPASPWSMSRYILVVFPLFIIFARLGKNEQFDGAATVGLALLQGFLMALWTTWGFYVI